MLVWFALSHGELARDWLKQMGADGNCAICCQRMLKIIQHRFIKWPCVLLWGAFKQLLNRWGSTNFVFFSWTHVLIGDIFSNFGDINSHRFQGHPVALPKIINRLTLLEHFSYFTYGMIDVPLLLEIVFFSI